MHAAHTIANENLCTINEMKTVCVLKDKRFKLR